MRCQGAVRRLLIVLSARADRFDKIRALDSGADDYVGKPFDFEELLARIGPLAGAGARIGGRRSYEPLTLDPRGSHCSPVARRCG